MAKTIEVIKSRVSCRSYSDKKVSLKKLNEILEAGRSAPSACNHQVANILAIRKTSLMKSLRELSLKVLNRDCMYGANTLVLVYGPRDDKFTVQDCSCILENIFVAATSLKIDSCWINQFDELLHSLEGKKLLKKLGLTEESYIVGSAILGYRSEGLVIDVKDKNNISIEIK